MKKTIIYQVLPRLFGNINQNRIENGTLAQNGVGKFSAFTLEMLHRIHDLGATHVWYTGVIRHATVTDYSSYNIPPQHAEVVKGKAGSPYAITDYYDVDPDLAEHPENRMEEWESLVSRTHQAGMKVIMDFVPNHVAREYHSLMKPNNVADLGEKDDTSMHFSPNNNFYYCPGEHLDLSAIVPEEEGAGNLYDEFPAKCTGNDRFDSHPQRNDWYETVKLNYGVDYTNFGGRSCHFDPVPDTWTKMTDILLYWASKGVDGFRCDMAEMVPAAFWAYATTIVKNRFPYIVFIGEVYDPSQYRNYLKSGFDYLYDKVGMYDCVRDVICKRRAASSITYQWQSTDDIKDHLLYFLENHDEQRVASDFFCGDGRKAIPGVIVSALLRNNPFMLYFGQEVGERGMDKEGFSGCDGRTTIFDYWCVDSVRSAYFENSRLTQVERSLLHAYQRILHIANEEKAFCEGDFFDLMYVNPQSETFNPRCEYAFLRKKDDDLILVVVNFGGEKLTTKVVIPEHAFDTLNLPEKEEVEGEELLTMVRRKYQLKRNGSVSLELAPYSGQLIRFNMQAEGRENLIPVHNKEEFAPAHTAEHLLNQLMVRLFGCERSCNAHVERKKSKMSFILSRKPTRQEEKLIEDKMNELIEADMPVTYEYARRKEIPAEVKLDRLPKGAGDTIRLVRIGDFDVCPCIGKHVRSTSQIGRFQLLGTNWDDTNHSFRVRFRVHP
ncbi:MAG: alpha-amylase family glycosyl hydrolase [Prevotella sp.]|nr:alpha-amylase family glycosyl hydrolase [Prevotella sp.]